MHFVSRVFIAACLIILSSSACAPKPVPDTGCTGLSIAYDPSQSFLRIGVTATQLHIGGDYHIGGGISDPSTVLFPVALVSLPPVPYRAFISLYDDDQKTQDLTYNQAGRDFLTREVGAGSEPLFSSGAAVAGIMEPAGKYVSIDLWFDGRLVNSAHFVGDKDHPVTIYLVAARGKANAFTCKTIASVVLTGDNIKVIDE